MPGGGHVTRTIEVLRSGTFTPMAGAAVTFSSDDLKAIASSYDGAGAPAPAVVGHPSTDAPAYAWARSFRYDETNDRLVADLAQIEPAFAAAVQEGRYKKISLSLFAPSAANNPKPGAWYPKHIGFLGAAAPAVPGLKPVSFAGDEGVVTFEFADATALRDVAGLFRALREWIIDKFGADVADKALPGYTIGWIDGAADRDPPEPYSGADLASPPAKEKKMDKDAVALAERERALDARERAANHADNLSYAESLIEAGKLLPALKDKVVGLLDGLAPVAGVDITVSLAEGNGSKASTIAVLDLVKEILKAQPNVVSFGAVDLGEGTASVDFVAPYGSTVDPASAELHSRALTYQRAHPDTDYMTAIAAVDR